MPLLCPTEISLHWNLINLKCDGIYLNDGTGGKWTSNNRGNKTNSKKLEPKSISKPSLRFSLTVKKHEYTCRNIPKWIKLQHNKVSKHRVIGINMNDFFLCCFLKPLCRSFSMSQNFSVSFRFNCIDGYTKIPTIERNLRCVSWNIPAPDSKTKCWPCAMCVTSVAQNDTKMESIGLNWNIKKCQRQ